MAKRILIVEDEMIIAADISLLLTNMGYEITGIIPRGEDALLSIENTPPDIVLLDIALIGELDGIETAQKIYEHFHIPVIFLTANTDDATFQRAKATKPYAFITKPFEVSDLQRAIEIVIERIEEEQNTEHHQEFPNGGTSLILDDRIFVRHQDKMVKIFIHDILFAEAGRNYCTVYTIDKSYLLTLPLRKLEDNLPEDHFMRVHRSFLVNLHEIDALTDNQENLVLGGKNVPVSRRFKEELLKRLRMI